LRSILVGGGTVDGARLRFRSKAGSRKEHVAAIVRTNVAGSPNGQPNLSFGAGAGGMVRQIGQPSALITREVASPAANRPYRLIVPLWFSLAETRSESGRIARATSVRINIVGEME